jgi:hypothetical protein
VVIVARYGVRAVLKHVQPTLLMFLSSVLSATLASAQPAEVVREQITLRGTVENVDDTVRTVRIRGDRGDSAGIGGTSSRALGLLWSGEGGRWEIVSYLPLVP